MNEEECKQLTTAYLRYINANLKISGTKYCQHMITKCLECPELLKRINTNGGLYQTTGAMFGRSSKNVERAVRYFIQDLYKRIPIQRFEAVFGCGSVTNKQFIELSCNFIRRNRRMLLQIL